MGDESVQYISMVMFQISLDAGVENEVEDEGGGVGGGGDWRDGGGCKGGGGGGPECLLKGGRMQLLTPDALSYSGVPHHQRRHRRHRRHRPPFAAVAVVASWPEV